MSHVPTPYECSDRDWRNQKHPTHWFICGDRIAGEDCDPPSSSDLTTAVAIVPGNDTSGEITRETAEFLCRAANAHAVLVGAIEAALPRLIELRHFREGVMGRPGVHERDFADAEAKLKAALGLVNPQKEAPCT